MPPAKTEVTHRQEAAELLALIQVQSPSLSLAQAPLQPGGHWDHHTVRSTNDQAKNVNSEVTKPWSREVAWESTQVIHEQKWTGFWIYLPFPLITSKLLTFPGNSQLSLFSVCSRGQVLGRGSGSVTQTGCFTPHPQTMTAKAPGSPAEAYGGVINGD